MNAHTLKKIESIANLLCASIVRADDDAVVLDDGASKIGVYRTSKGWIYAYQASDHEWRSTDAPKEYLRENLSFNYLCASSLERLAKSVNVYRGPVSALRAQVYAVRGD